MKKFLINCDICSAPLESTTVYDLAVSVDNQKLIILDLCLKCKNNLMTNIAHTIDPSKTNRSNKL